MLACWNSRNSRPSLEVDARGLDLDVGVREGLDDEVALLEPPENVRVREYHTPITDGGSERVPFFGAGGFDGEDRLLDGAVGIRRE